MLPQGEWTKIDEEVEIIETNRTPDEIDVWYVDRLPAQKKKATARTSATATVHQVTPKQAHQLPIHHHNHPNHQYSTSLEGGLNKMGMAQSKSKPKKKNMKKISESVPNLEEIPVAVTLVPKVPNRRSLDQRVLNEIAEDKDALYSSCDHSSSIELNSILHRDSGFFISKCSDAKSAPFPEAHSITGASEMNNDFGWYAPKNKLDGFELKVNNPIWGKKRSNLARETGDQSMGPSPGRFYTRFSKSIQNLFNFNSDSDKVSSSARSRKSVSEVNLAKIKKGRGGKVGDSNVLGTPYCPSSWFTMKTNLKRNSTMDSPKGPFKRAWRKYKSMGLFRRNARQRR